MLVTIITILLSLPSAILAIMQIVAFKSNNKLHTVNIQKSSKNIIQIANDNECQSVVGNSNIQKINSDNVSISVNNNYNYYLDNQRSDNSSSVDWADVVAILIFILALFLYRNQFICLILAVFSSLLYYYESKNYWEEEKNKLHCNVILISSFVTFIVFLILSIISDNDGITNQLNNSFGFLYSFLSVLIVCAFIAAFVWSNYKLAFNIVMDRYAHKVKYRFAVYKDTKRYMIISILLLFIQLISFALYIKYSF